ncbi:MAG: hypothetical protein HYU67_04625 [Flavobacteriia bacterium]|nr:hypothetical protein [Flavobacteriia bacterium]
MTSNELRDRNIKIDEKLIPLYSKKAELDGQIAKISNQSTEFVGSRSWEWAFTGMIGKIKDRDVLDLSAIQQSLITIILGKIKPIAEEIKVLEAEKAQNIEDLKSLNKQAEDLAKTGQSAASLEIQAQGVADAMKLKAQEQSKAEAEISKDTAKKRNMIIIIGGSVVLLLIGVIVISKLLKK